ncbi:MAG: hypothetical protein RMM51_11920, partial [Verrucomicrobiae bacterium]|nr:hypothetical protein [Verrucomicrobiae bacterium]
MRELVVSQAFRGKNCRSRGRFCRCGCGRAAYRHEFAGGTGFARAANEMNVSLTQAAAGMTAVARWQEVIAQNLAGAVVPGF